MQRFLAVLFLFVLLSAREPGTAHATPVLPRPLCDRELASNNAGQSVVIRLVDKARDSQMTVAGLGGPPARGLFDRQDPSAVRTSLRNTGESSLGVAATAIVLQARLTDAGLRPAVQRGLTIPARPAS